MNDEIVRVSDEEIEAFLEHWGVKGMHWGVRNPNNRALNKASRQKDRQKHQKAVLKARATINSGKLNVEFAKAKAQFHKDKERIGSREARKIFNKTKAKHWAIAQKSQEAANGKEAALALLVVAGALGIQAFAHSKANQF